jgi:hypothetical protein
MVHSSTLGVTTDGECLTCGGFSLAEIIFFGSHEFIADCFISLSLSPRGSDSCAVFMGTTRSGSPSLRAMIEDSTDEFHTTSSEEGSSGLPTSRRHNTGASPAAIATTAWPEDTPTTQTMMTVPPCTLAPRPNTRLLLERWHAF